MPIHHSGRFSSLSNCSALSPVSAGGRPVGVVRSPSAQEHGLLLLLSDAAAVPKM